MPARWLTCVLALFFIGAFAVLGLTGCGGDDDDDDDDDATPCSGDECLDDDDDDTSDDDDDDDTSDDDTGDDDTFDERAAVLDFPVDRTVNLPTLDSEVRVAYDQYKIPYVFAESRADLARVLGYVMAEQRFFQMDFLRKLPQGTLGEYLGIGSNKAPLIDYDYSNRLIYMNGNGDSVLDLIVDSLDADTKELLEGLAEGVNAWLAEKRAEEEADTLTGWDPSYDVALVKPSKVADWTTRDTIAFARYQTWDLSGTRDAEISLTDWKERLAGNPSLYADFFTRAMATDTTIIKDGEPGFDDLAKSGAAAGGHTISPEQFLPKGYHGLRDYLAAQERLPKLVPFARDREASNNWVISPDLNDGVGFVANDPHLSLVYPSVWNYLYIDTKALTDDGDIRSWGASFPGTPGVVAGANENVAWGETVAGYDVVDVYAEEITCNGSNEPTKVKFKGGDVNVIKKTLKIASRIGSTNKAAFFVPHHGPILPETIDCGNKTALSFRWTGHDPSNEIGTFLGFNLAQDVDDMFAAIDKFRVGAQNFVFQDTAGNIGYFPNACVPNRGSWVKTYNPWLVLPGDGSAEWDETTPCVPAADMPKLKNPERGWVVTANNDINGTLQSDDPTDGDRYWHWDRAIGYRAQRIEERVNELLDAGTPFTHEDMQSIQLDVQGNYARDVLTGVLDILDSDLVTGFSTDSQAALAYLNDWDFQFPTGLSGFALDSPASTDADTRERAVAATIFSVFVKNLKGEIYGDEFDDEGESLRWGMSSGDVAVRRIVLDEGDPFWDDTDTGGTQTPRTIINRAMNDAVADLKNASEFPEFDGADMDEWYWGRIHELVIEHLFEPSLNLGTYAREGSPYTPNVARYSDGDYAFDVGSGPSVRLVNEFDSGQIRTFTNLPGGQVQVSDGEHADDLLQLWLAGDYYEMPNTVQKVLDAAVEMYSFSPVK
ncbi:MAG: penicillin acylase family protein [Deltaproteobacteria bacterium]|nr:penicillin acylase family protein [Deltaproteobacteria bacterium]